MQITIRFNVDKATSIKGILGQVERLLLNGDVNYHPIELNDENGNRIGTLSIEDEEAE